MSNTNGNAPEADLVVHQSGVTLPGARYSLTRSFILRMPGFAIDLIDSMASEELASSTDEVAALARTFEEIASLLSLRDLDKGGQRSLKRRQAVNPDSFSGTGIERLQQYNDMSDKRRNAQDRTAELYESELERVRRLLYLLVREERFKEVLLLSSPGLTRFTPKSPEPPALRNSHIRQREYTWISYLQRLATKNETISFFGPTAWGQFDPKDERVVAVEFEEDFIDRRCAYVERWVCEALADLLSRSDDMRAFIPARLADDLSIEARVSLCQMRI